MAWFRSSQQPTQSTAAPAARPASPAAAAAATAAAQKTRVPAVGVAAPAPDAPANHPAHESRAGGTQHGARVGGHGYALPCLGYPEAYYLKHVHDADQRGDQVAHDAYKVGQYVTLGLDHKESCERKAKYFGHALRRHANPPPDADGHVQDFYRRLADLVRKSAGQEVLRLTRREHEILQKRQAGGANHQALAVEFED